MLINAKGLPLELKNYMVISMNQLEKCSLFKVHSSPFINCIFGIYGT